jgi:hypothetical protein
MANNRAKQPKKDITLMTLLAYESTAPARKLLQKHGFEDAKSYGDLEVKLAELYFDSPNKMEIEKELAEIHPHKDWLLRVTKVNEPIKEEKIEVKSEPIAPPTPAIISELKSNADGGSTTPDNSHAIMLNYVGLIGVVGVTLTLAIIGLKMVKN